MALQQKRPGSANDKRTRKVDAAAWFVQTD